MVSIMQGSCLGRVVFKEVRAVVWCGLNNAGEMPWASCLQKIGASCGVVSIMQGSCLGRVVFK